MVTKPDTLTLETPSARKPNPLRTLRLRAPFAAAPAPGVP
jgi:hypothetical protein